MPRDPYAAAQRRADRKEAEAKRKAARRYLKQADVLDEQIEALKTALGSGGFRKALRTRLANISRSERQQDRVILDAFGERSESLLGAAEDNEKAESDQSAANVSNRARERASAISEALLQGAGESDLLRAQSMSLKNWEANQSEVSRSFFDTMRSINSSITDLNADTKSARASISTQANADREQMYTNYYNQRGEAFTQLGNIYGQQAELYGMANEAVGSRRTRRRLRRAERSMGNAFDGAARMASTAWRNPGLSSELRSWDGMDTVDAQQNMSTYVEPTDLGAPAKKPEGATLRKW